MPRRFALTLLLLCSELLGGTALGSDVPSAGDVSSWDAGTYITHLASGTIERCTRLVRERDALELNRHHFEQFKAVAVRELAAEEANARNTPPFRGDATLRDAVADYAALIQRHFEVDLSRLTEVSDQRPTTDAVLREMDTVLERMNRESFDAHAALLSARPICVEVPQ
jgi:hypothetical protein